MHLVFSPQADDKIFMDRAGERTGFIRGYFYRMFYRRQEGAGTFSAVRDP